MTPKEKAIELVERFNVLQTFIEGFDYEHAIECALIAVDEILNYDLKAKTESQFVIERRIEEYWQEVKQEVEKL